MKVRAAPEPEYDPLGTRLRGGPEVVGGRNGRISVDDPRKITGTRKTKLPCLIREHAHKLTDGVAGRYENGSRGERLGAILTAIMDTFAMAQIFGIERRSSPSLI